MATNKLPDKAYLTDQELADRWDCAINDVHYYFEEGLLRYGVERNFSSDKYSTQKSRHSISLMLGKEANKHKLSIEKLAKIVDDDNSLLKARSAAMADNSMSKLREGLSSTGEAVLDHISQWTRESITWERFFYISAAEILNDADDEIEVSALQNFNGSLYWSSENDIHSESEIKTFEDSLVIQKSKIIFPKQEIERFEKQHFSSSRSAQSPVNEDKLLMILYGMAISKYDYNPANKRNTATGENNGSIHADLQSLGLSVDVDTIRKYMKLAEDKFAER